MMDFATNEGNIVITDDNGTIVDDKMMEKIKDSIEDPDGKENFNPSNLTITG